MRCLRCALEFGPEERYCLRCGRSLSRPLGTDKGDNHRSSTIQDTQYLYTTHSPPPMGDTPSAPRRTAAEAQAPPSTGTGSVDGAPRSPVLADGGMSQAVRDEQPENTSFPTRLRRLHDENAMPGGVHIAPPQYPEAVPWDEQIIGGLPLGDEDDEDLPVGPRVKPIAIGLDGDSWPTTAGRRRGWRNPLLVAAVIVAAVVTLIVALGVIRYRAYGRDLQTARAQAAVGAIAAARSNYQTAIGEWPFNDTAKRELASLREPTVTAVQPGTADTTAAAMRQAMFQARSAQRQAAARQSDADAVASATGVTQATMTAQDQATANALATGTAAAAKAAATAAAQGKAAAQAALHAAATAQARGTAGTVAATVATARADASATVIHLPSGGTNPVVYAAIGASDAVGVGAANPATESWVADLARKLPSGSQVINLGKSGAQLSYGLQQELPAAIASHPDVVTVWMAVNDIDARVPPAVYRQELDTLVSALRTQTHAAIYVGNVPDLTLLPLYHSLDKAQLTAVIQTYNGIIAQVAAAHKATVVDLFHESQRTLPAHPEYVSSDGFHPSTSGHVDLANYWWSVMHQG